MTIFAAALTIAGTGFLHPGYGSASPPLSPLTPIGDFKTWIAVFLAAGLLAILSVALHGVLSRRFARAAASGRPPRAASGRGLRRLVPGRTRRPRVPLGAPGPRTEGLPFGFEILP
ncbi:MAG: hypothetical protein MUC63_06290 [Planctomycetes bacterium]|jgi:hypothetical protein|nr:hypothetical protein [Planctomycetota bacterium]